jgi:hypothetical protein
VGGHQAPGLCADAVDADESLHLSSSASGAGDRPASRTYRETETENGDRGLFDAVLRETESALGNVDSDAGGILAELRDVARVYAGQPFDPESIGVALIRVVLDRQVSRAVADSRVWRQARTRVAETLCADPVARARLERLWERLQADVR